MAKFLLKQILAQCWLKYNTLFLPTYCSKTEMEGILSAIYERSVMLSVTGT
jgi:hypothetical protein